MSAGRGQAPKISKAPDTIMHNGIEFISTIEAAKRMNVDIRTVAQRAQRGLITPYRIPGIGTFGVRRPHYFKADEIRKFMP
jgi:hypothetical protein